MIKFINDFSLWSDNVKVPKNYVKCVEMGDQCGSYYCYKFLKPIAKPIMRTYFKLTGRWLMSDKPTPTYFVKFAERYVQQNHTKIIYEKVLIDDGNTLKTKLVEKEIPLRVAWWNKI